MTEAEKELIETKFAGLAELFEAKLKASEGVICSKVSGIEEKFVDTKETIDEHVAWHDNLNKKIVAGTIKYGLIAFVVVVAVVLFLGIKDGIIPSVFAKMIG